MQTELDKIKELTESMVKNDLLKIVELIKEMGNSAEKDGYFKPGYELVMAMHTSSMYMLEYVKTVLHFKYSNPETQVNIGDAAETITNLAEAQLSLCETFTKILVNKRFPKHD